MRLQKTFRKKFMKWKLTIDIYNDKWEWLIQYDNMSWLIPQDIKYIINDLCINLDIEVAKIIYETIIDHYNDTIVEMKMSECGICDRQDVGHNTVAQVSFPPFPVTYTTTKNIWDFGIYADSIGPYVNSLNEIIYCTHQQYYEWHNNGWLQDSKVYFIYK